MLPYRAAAAPRPECGRRGGVLGAAPCGAPGAPPVAGDHAPRAACKGLHKRLHGSLPGGVGMGLRQRWVGGYPTAQGPCPCNRLRSRLSIRRFGIKILLHQDTFSSATSLPQNLYRLSCPRPRRRRGWGYGRGTNGRLPAQHRRVLGQGLPHVQVSRTHPAVPGGRGCARPPPAHPAGAGRAPALPPLGTPCPVARYRPVRPVP